MTLLDEPQGLLVNML